MRDPHARRWVTVGVADIRPNATGVAADGYRDLRNQEGATPTQVRVVTAGQLRREGGQHDVDVAAADAARGGVR